MARILDNLICNGLHQLFQAKKKNCKKVKPPSISYHLTKCSYFIQRYTTCTAEKND
jgi:hypothetical protein